MHRLCAALGQASDCSDVDTSAGLPASWSLNDSNLYPWDLYGGSSGTCGQPDPYYLTHGATGDDIDTYVPNLDNPYTEDVEATGGSWPMLTEEPVDFSSMVDGNSTPFQSPCDSSIPSYVSGQATVQSVIAEDDIPR